MTTVSEEAREGSATAAEQVPGITADAPAQARASVPPTALLPSEAVTQRARALHRALVRIAEFLDRPESLVHHHPPTFARARERHHEAAGRHSVRPFAHLRLVWGYVHLLLIKPVLNFLEWVTETPLRLFAAVILFTVIWIWS